MAKNLGPAIGTNPGENILYKRSPIRFRTLLFVALVCLLPGIIHSQLLGEPARVPNLFIGISAGHVGFECCGGAGVNASLVLPTLPLELGLGFRYVQSDGSTKTDLGNRVSMFSELFGFVGARIPIGELFSLMVDAKI